jgi:hypothetical protein
LKRQIIYTNPSRNPTTTTTEVAIQHSTPVLNFNSNQVNSNTMCSLFLSRVNYVGNDLWSKFSQNIDQCCSECSSTKGCNGWSYNTLSKICYFKSHMTQSETDLNFISGFPTYSSYVCRSGKILSPNLFTSCASYYACTKDSVEKFHYVVLDCPDKLVFNSDKNQCDYPDNVTCN